MLLVESPLPVVDDADADAPSGDAPNVPADVARWLAGALRFQRLMDGCRAAEAAASPADDC